MPANTVEFLEFVESTGDTTRRALYRVSQRDEWSFSVGVGLTRSVAATLSIADTEIHERLPGVRPTGRRGRLSERNYKMIDTDSNLRRRIE